MKYLFSLLITLVACCPGERAHAATEGAAKDWPMKWCQAEPGITRQQLVGLMGKPTTDFETGMSWSDHHYQFNAFFEQNGTVKQLDINLASLTEVEKAALQCKETRTRRSMTTHTTNAAKADRPACEMLSQSEVSAILGTAMSAQASGRSKCVYKASGASHAYLEFSIDRGDGAAAMAGAGFASRGEPGLTSRYDGIGDQAVAAGPALLIRTGDDLVTIVLSGVSDPRTAVRKIFDAAKPNL